ncbi:hypothetical protein [Siphonobacter curvatus]|uniref:Uncharacterized protein n=1 Tax=Siphonobacter curvatus TaxID=2094562 RepID=A0A2S7IR94_9BACT|nr:hypothetical protein [Siphonobacter curvatus]PQA60158.1 hypothetical protein C5O19_11225 [Siphonobacter curvatus]
MVKKAFYKEEFYLRPHLTISVFDRIKSQELDRDFEMYGSGEFLFMAALDSPASREILSDVIIDLEAYQEYYKGAYSEASPGAISLCGLQDEHRQVHGNAKELMWDEERQTFMSAESFFADDEEDYESENDEDER